MQTFYAFLSKFNVKWSTCLSTNFRWILKCSTVPFDLCLSNIYVIASLERCLQYLILNLRSWCKSVKCEKRILLCFLNSWILRLKFCCIIWDEFQNVSILAEGADGWRLGYPLVSQSVQLQVTWSANTQLKTPREFCQQLIQNQSFEMKCANVTARLINRVVLSLIYPAMSYLLFFFHSCVW